MEKKGSCERAQCGGLVCNEINQKLNRRQHLLQDSAYSTSYMMMQCPKKGVLQLQSCASTCNMCAISIGCAVQICASIGYSTETCTPRLHEIWSWPVFHVSHLLTTGPVPKQLCPDPLQLEQRAECGRPDCQSTHNAAVTDGIIGTHEIFSMPALLLVRLL